MTLILCGKFKNWNEHRTDPKLKGTEVTEDQKIKRAQEIASFLSDNNKWKSHGRPINIEALHELRLEVEDYSNQEERRKLIRDYYELLADYVLSRRYHNFIHTKKFI